MRVEDDKRNEKNALYYELLQEIQAVDFVLVELTLYLDTHPCDQCAIQQFNENVAKAAELKHQFQCQFGPLYQYGNSYSTYPWTWSESPWPWQV
ncbi:MAG: spore coat protein CotJB [Bacilli bacterium]